MRNTLITVAILLLLTGIVWILQGFGVLPGSFMTGEMKWAYAGMVSAVLGGGLLWIALWAGRA
jgi:hypothetical protein